MSRRRLCHIAFSALLAAATLFAPAAHAVVTYCVGTPAQFQDALDQAEIDADDSRIDVQSGSYEILADLRYQPEFEFIIEPGSLTIEGGYGAGCASRIDDARQTILNGNGVPMLRLFANRNSILFKTMSFNGVSLFAADAGIADSCAGSNLEFEFRRVRIANASLQIGAAQCHDVVVRDSLLTNGVSHEDHQEPDTSLDAYLIADDDVDVASTLTLINTTVVDGLVDVHTCCDYRNRANFYNTILQRDGTDLRAEATNVYTRNSRYDTIGFVDNNWLPAGVLVDGSGNNTSADPDLDGSFRPNPDSPMVNSGTSNVPDGLLSIDVYGGPRVIGSAVDRGALESPVDGSSTYTVTNTNPSGAGSLADAVNLANNDSGFNLIRFNIPGNCPRRISVTSTLHIRDSVEIDGTTQPGSRVNDDDLFWTAVPCVILDGGDVVGTGILTDPQIASGHLVARGLAFEGFETALLLVFGSDNLVYGNQFGGRIGDAGPVLSGNGNAITVAAPGSALIGGTDNALANLIGGSSETAVVITGNSDGNQLVNNRIGVDKDVVHDLPNQDGVHVTTSDNRIVGNRISRNTRDGVLIAGPDAHGNVVRDNTLGGNFSDFLGLSGNGRMGVMIDNGAYGNTIGPGNLIARNGDSGVRVTSAAMGHNSITGNDIGLNEAPGIDLGPNGVTDNDLDPQVCNLTEGCPANREQNFPVIEDAWRVEAGEGGTVYLFFSGFLISTVSSTPYRVDFYRSAECDVSGHGQGLHWLGSHNVVVENEGFCSAGNCAGSFGFAFVVTGVEEGDAVTATATSPSGDTSEFSECAVVVPGTLVFDRIFADDFDD